MKITTFITGCALALAVLLFAQKHRPEATPVTFHGVVDLTRTDPSSSDSLLASTRRGEQTDTGTRKMASAGSILRSTSTATRIEAPALYAKSLWTVDQIPPERLVGQLAVLDVRAEVKNNPGYEISMNDIMRWEKANGQIPLGAVVVAETGWKPGKSIDEKTGAKQLPQVPGYSGEAAKFLVEARNVRGLGIDAPRLHFGTGSSWNSPVSQYTLSHSVYHLENIASLERVPATGAVVMVAPMKLQGRADGPVRVLALVK